MQLYTASALHKKVRQTVAQIYTVLIDGHFKQKDECFYLELLFQYANFAKRKKFSISKYWLKKFALETTVLLKELKITLH